MTTAPCRLEYLSPVLQKTGYLLFLFLRSSDLSHLRPATATGPTPDLVNLMSGFVQMSNLPSRTSCTAATPPKLSKDHSASARPLFLPDRARSHHLMTFNRSSEQDFVFRCSTMQNSDNLQLRVLGTLGFTARTIDFSDFQKGDIIPDSLCPHQTHSHHIPWDIFRLSSSILPFGHGPQV